MRGLFDRAFAAACLLLLWPLLAVLAALIKLTSRGPIFYRARRIGFQRKPFVLYKFRTMKHNAAGSAITARHDPRVTSLGRVLRRWKIDELPQLLNVLKGEMALVGPRPEDERYVQLYSDEELRVLDVLPGITSPVSLRFRNEEEMLGGSDWHDKYVNEVMHEKLRGELEYLQKKTFWSDLGVLWKTVTSLTSRDSASVTPR